MPRRAAALLLALTAVAVAAPGLAPYDPGGEIHPALLVTCTKISKPLED